MNWIDQIVEKILRRYPNQESYTCACGLSTTGIAHVGNFREILITYFVTKRLRELGKNVRFILSFDDYDRLKKVPYGVDQSFSNYVGMANCNVPSPIEDYTGSYAEYYEDLVKQELTELGIFPEYIRQSERYKNHVYDNYIKMAIDKKDEIFNIISKYKTQTLNDEDKSNYYPFKIYCSQCGKDFTSVIENNLEKNEIIYTCTCGAKKVQKIEDLNAKLNFNVDWPMRWNFEKVNFEPCGRGHAAPNGVLNVSSEISEMLFENTPPVIKSYEFVKSSSKGRMNKNSNQLVTITKLLEIMPKEMIFWMFIIEPPNHEMVISLDEYILKLYNKYENMLSSNDEKSVKIRNFIGVTQVEHVLKFNDLVRYLPICNFNIDKLKKYIDFDFDNKQHLMLIKYATNWLNMYCKDRYWEFNFNKNEEHWSTLSEIDKEVFREFNLIIMNDDNLNLQYDMFIQKLKENDQLTSFYKNFYQLIFGVERGIPIKTILENYDIKMISHLLKFDIEKNNAHIKKKI